MIGFISMFFLIGVSIPPLENKSSRVFRFDDIIAEFILYLIFLSISFYLFILWAGRFWSVKLGYEEMGFSQGFWRGFGFAIRFVHSIFCDFCGIFERNNTGFTYYFGFFVGYCLLILITAILIRIVKNK